MQPHSHTIIEAHPDVYKYACSLGWDRKPGVRLVLGRWQDVIADLDPFDGIFFDTYGAPPL
jgi:protein arginine N-methyltransferase 2